MKKYKIALFIGRFQPFHKGHLYSLEKCLEIAEKVIVGIGSSEISGTADNPWDYKTRVKMIESIDLQGVSLKVMAIPDMPTDEEWLKEVERIVGKFDVVVSNNEWVLSIFKEADYHVVESGLHNRDELEGVKIREMMRVGDAEWKSRVPKEVVDKIEMSVI